MSELSSLAPECILAITALALLFVRGAHAHLIALVSLMAALGTLPFLPQGQFFFGAFELNDFVLVFKALFLGIAFFIVLGSQGTIPTEWAKEYHALVLFATVGMLGVAGAAELITLFISFELASLSAYALVGYVKREERSLEAATKFFIVGALSSALSLYGISLLYGVTATTAIKELAVKAFQASDLALAFTVGMIFVLAGFGFKVTVVPFHFWAPDVYEGAPAPVTALLAGGSKKMGFVALIKIFLVGLLAFKLDWGLLFGVLALLTMTVGNLLALTQTSVKRMMAYSSIAHAGYILMAFPVATAYGLAGGLFQIVTHAITTAGVFLVVAALTTAGEDFSAYQGLKHRQPFLAFVMLLSLLSLAGVPPLPGFQSKFVLFGSAIEAGLRGESWLIMLAIAGIANSALSLAFYARVIKAMYVEEPQLVMANPYPSMLSVPPLLLTALALELAFVVAVAFYPEPLLEVLLHAARVIVP